MPKSCVAVNCTNHNMKSPPGVQKLSFHVFPKDKARRERWIQAVRRIKEDQSRWSPSRHAVLCGAHFIEGRPHSDPNHPDFVPSIFSHNTKATLEKSATKLKRFEAVKRRHARQKLFDEPAVKVLATSELQDMVEEPVADVSDPDPVKPSASSAASELTESERHMFLTEMDKLRAERDNALLKCKELEDKNLHLKLTAGNVIENDAKCRYYTGLCWETFYKTYNFLESSCKGTSQISNMDQFFITLVKLRFGIPFQFIADHAGFSETTISKMFWDWIDIMNDELSFVITFPDCDTVSDTLPPHFKDKFPRLTTIIDSFEILIDQPKNLKARVSTYSHYKKQNTVKFLIGCTPQGVVSFLSKAWGGGVSDTELVKRSGVLESSHHSPGDQMLAGRGFSIEENVASACGAQLILPTRGKKELSAQQIETSRKIASVRTHIEQIIGLMKNRYAILQGTLPIKVVKSVKDEVQAAESTSIDRLVRVCAALVNLGEGMVEKQCGESVNKEKTNK